MTPAMLDGLTIVLNAPKFPENVGAAARACANMGCPNLVVVAPRQWDMDKALALATPKGAEILKRMRLEETLPAALAGLHTVYGATARTGGWRKGCQTPAQAGPDIAGFLAQGMHVGVVFGAEDRGLTNEDIEICGRLLTIPTAADASSLNLAQAVLIVLYECFTRSLDKPFRPKGPPHSPLATHAEQETLFAVIQETLLAIDFLKPDNPDYWMLPVRRFMQRIRLRRNDFNLLMGICRQVQWMARQLPQKK